VLDAVALEKRGIHTVTIVWDNFQNAALTQARLQDCADLALAVIPHRKGGDTAEDQRRKAELALPGIVSQLVQPL
jgi:hypothetical protein